MANQAYSTCALPEGLRYYLLRGSMMVPLVPADQLPYQLQGIPHQLTHRQISDGDWKLCSETNDIASELLVQAPTAISVPSHPVLANKSRYLAPDYHVRVEPQAMPASETRSSRLSQPFPAIATTAVPPHTAPATLERPSSLTDTFASIYQKDAQRLGYRVPHPSGIEPDPSKKEYCTHWIKTGECDWTAVGCKFKHEMPSIEKLRELGFVRGIPRWWKEKSAIVARPPTWMQRRLAGNEDAEQAGTMPEARMFPDPLSFRVRKAEGRDLLDDEVQQPRGILKRSPSPRQATMGRPTPPPTPAREPSRAARQVSDLLIDLDDTSAPPPSPESSCSSVASAESSEEQIPPSRTSASLPSSPKTEREASLPVHSKTPPKTVVTKNTTDKEPSTRRHSSVSWASDTEDDTPMLTKPTTKSPRPTQHRRKPASRSSHNNKRPATTPTKPYSGLAASKHATNDHATKTSANHGRNGNRKLHGKSGGESEAPELHAKIEQLRREVHQKERVRKATVSAVPVAARGTIV
jgi:hypothetical protein